MERPAEALAGCLLWAAACLWLQPPLLVVLLLVGPLVVVPLSMGLVSPPPQRAAAKAWPALRWAGLPAAALAAVSFREAPGVAAAAWTAPWLAWTGLVALAALARFVGHRRRPLAEVALDAGLAFPFVGAFWLAVSRLGVSFLGFGDPIALLTAAHFSLAGIAVPVLAGLAARRLPGRMGLLAAFGSVSGLPFVAAGITLQAQGVRLVNVAAVAYFALAMLALSLLHARLAMRSASWPRVLWGVAALSLPVGMALALAYASAEITGHAISIGTMVRTHAVINVFGFTIPALAAWWMEPQR